MKPTNWWFGRFYNFVGNRRLLDRCVPCSYAVRRCWRNWIMLMMMAQNFMKMRFWCTTHRSKFTAFIQFGYFGISFKKKSKLLLIMWQILFCQFVFDRIVFVTLIDNKARFDRNTNHNKWIEWMWKCKCLDILADDHLPEL